MSYVDLALQLVRGWLRCGKQKQGPAQAVPGGDRAFMQVKSYQPLGGQG